MGIKTVPQPPYSRDFWLFLKLRGCRYETIEEMKETVTNVIDTLTQEDFHGTFQLLERYNKCVAAGGDCFEGHKSFKCVLSMKVRIRKKSGNLFNDPRIYMYIYKTIPNIFGWFLVLYVCVESTCFKLFSLDLYRLIGLVGRVFANGPGDLASIPGQVIPKTLKMLLDISLLNTQQYKVRIKGRVEQSSERSSALLYILV